VGLATTAITPYENLYEKLSKNLKSMIEQGELQVISKEDDELVWD